MKTLIATLLLALTASLPAQWTLRPNGPAPYLVPKTESGMAYVPTLNRTYLLGGFYFFHPIVPRAIDIRMHWWDHANPSAGWTHEPFGDTPCCGIHFHRGGHEMVWVASAGRLLAYGGLSGSGGVVSRLPMLFDPANPVNGWQTTITETGQVPDRRTNFGMVYVPGHDRIYLIGGSVCIPGGNPCNWVGWDVRQTYLYEGRLTMAATPNISWKELRPSGLWVPRQLIGCALGYDQNNGKLMLWGGNCLPAGCVNQLVQQWPVDTSATSATWEQPTVSGGRYLAATAFGYGGLHQFLGLWNGVPQYENRTFRWSTPLQQWFEQPPTGPTGRFGTQATFSGSHFLLFGGELAPNTYTSQTWTWVPSSDDGR